MTHFMLEEKVNKSPLLCLCCVQLLSCVWLFSAPQTVARQAALSFIISWSLLKLMSTESMMPLISNHLILCLPLLLCLQFSPASESFPMSQLFASGGQRIGATASATVLPMNIQGWFPSGWTGLISLLSKGFSRVFSSTVVQKYQFFGAQPSLWSNSHILTWLLERPQPWLYRSLLAKWCLCFFNTLSRFVIAFLPRSKCLLISWLQSLPAVVWEPKKIQSAAVAAAAKSLQSCPTLCDPIDGSPPGSPILGILQARTLEWVAISFSNAWNWKVKVKSFSRVQLLATSWTAAYQAPPFMGFSRQEYWSRVPLPSPKYSLGCCKNSTAYDVKEQLLSSVHPGSYFPSQRKETAGVLCTNQP